VRDSLVDHSRSARSDCRMVGCNAVEVKDSKRPRCQKSMNHEGHEVSRRTGKFRFSSCAFVSFVVHPAPAKWRLLLASSRIKRGTLTAFKTVFRGGGP
jgi:hypothetical protein